MGVENELILLLSGVMGLVIGSFLNVAIIRTHEKEEWGGRSRCVHCKALIRWFDNIPLLSFVALRGKCRSCRRRINIQYPLVEATMAVVMVMSAAVRLAQGGTDDMLWLVLARDWLVGAALVAIFVYDARWYEIPDRFSLPGIAVALLANLALGVSWRSLALGIAVGGGFFLLQYVVSRGRWIGGGDIRLGALMGAALAWPLVAVALFLAYVVGALISVVLIAVRKKTWQATVPFGTFLAPATLVTLLWGEMLLDWYIHTILSL